MAKFRFSVAKVGMAGKHRPASQLLTVQRSECDSHAVVGSHRAGASGAVGLEVLMLWLRWLVPPRRSKR